MSVKRLRFVECGEFPTTFDTSVVFRLTPQETSEAYYNERVDRNIGWITKNMQDTLRSSTIGVAGCGGMGGLLAERAVRTGIGRVKLADNESFDLTNTNRQFAARRDTIGTSKAIATAESLRAISNDTELHVYPQGITNETVAHFIESCDLIFAEIEIFALEAYVLLHQHARRAGIDIIDGLVVGWGTNLFYYTPGGYRVEDMLGFPGTDTQALEQIKHLAQQIKAGSFDARTNAVNRIINAFVPNLPTYTEDGSDRALVLERLRQGKASIVAPSPLLATGVAMVRAILYLLQRGAGCNLSVEPLPEAPGFLSVDMAKCTIERVTRERVGNAVW